MTLFIRVAGALLVASNLQAQSGAPLQVKRPDGSAVSLAAASVDSLRRTQLRQAVVFVGADGYSALIALSDLDASIGGRRAILVDREDEQPLSAEYGPRRIMIEGDQRPTRWVRQVVRLEVVDVR